MSSLLSIGNDAKTVKGEKLGYRTAILYLAPHTLGGGKTICPFSTAGCREVCLYSAGRGAFSNVEQARLRKTAEFLGGPIAQQEFITNLKTDITRFVEKTLDDKMIPCVRLNGTSDIRWEDGFHIMDLFPDVQFYDYTKYPPHMRKNIPPNYHLTYSYSGDDPSRDKWVGLWMDRGVNVATVFSHDLPDTFMGYPVLDGDVSDLRFLDAPGHIVGLKAKGKARTKQGNIDGFIVPFKDGDNRTVLPRPTKERRAQNHVDSSKFAEIVAE